MRSRPTSGRSGSQRRSSERSRCRHTDGDLSAALGRITAKTFVMPIGEEMFFAVRDCKAEQELIADVELRVVESVVGHLGLFGFEEGYMEQIDRHLAELLEPPARPVSAILGTGTAEACSSSLALSQPLQASPSATS